MYGIFIYIWVIFMVGKYTIHGYYGVCLYQQRTLTTDNWKWDGLRILIDGYKVSGTLGMVPLLFNPPEKPFKRGYTQYISPTQGVYGVKGTIPRVPPFSL